MCPWDRKWKIAEPESLMDEINVIIMLIPLSLSLSLARCVVVLRLCNFVIQISFE